jgi:hypothetical protein
MIERKIVRYGKTHQSGYIFHVYGVSLLDRYKLLLIQFLQRAREFLPLTEIPSAHTIPLKKEPFPENGMNIAKAMRQAAEQLYIRNGGK